MPSIVKETTLKNETLAMRRWLTSCLRTPIDTIDMTLVHRFYPILLVEWVKAVRHTTNSSAKATAYHRWVTWAQQVIKDDRSMRGRRGGDTRDVTPSAFMARGTLDVVGTDEETA